jgi:DNA polymerase/3'-5' exonuclease PolX
MPKADAQQVVKSLREYAQRTALRGGNPYRAKAYSRAADSLTALAEPLYSLIEDERLTEIPRVGEAIADIITKLHRTGTHPSLEKLRKEVPAGVLEMLTVPGLRPEKVLRLYKDLGLASFADLEAAAKDDPHQEGKGAGRGVADQDPAESCDRQGRRGSASHASGGRPAAACKGGPRENPARTQTCDDRRRLQAGLRARR